MKIKKWIKLTEEVRDSNPFWTYKVDRYKIPDQREGSYYYVHTAGSSFIIPLMADNKILMVRQYRYLNEEFSLEFPGGGIKEGEFPHEVAQKELIEETGYSGELEKIGYFNPFNGVTNEICHVFVARNLMPSNKYKKDSTEEFELIPVTVSDLEQKIHNNEIIDGMTLAAWILAKGKF